MLSGWLGEDECGMHGKADTSSMRMVQVSLILKFSSFIVFEDIFQAHFCPISKLLYMISDGVPKSSQIPYYKHKKYMTNVS
jgi:hypothetical protein